MAITKGAKKAHRASLNKRVFNLRTKKVLKGTVKEAQTLIGSGKVEDAKKLLPKAYKAIDKAAKKGIIKKNTAARKKSKLVKAITSAK